MPGGAAWKDAVSLHDLEALARAAMDPEAFDFVAGGAGDEVTLRENAAAFARRRLWPRVLRGVVGVDTSATMLGAPVSMPVGLAPAALQGLAHPDGEIAAARAAASAGVVYCLSTVSTHPIEAVGAATDGTWWFQLAGTVSKPTRNGIVWPGFSGPAAASGVPLFVVSSSTLRVSRCEFPFIHRATRNPQLGTGARQRLSLETT